MRFTGVTLMLSAPPSPIRPCCVNVELSSEMSSQQRDEFLYRNPRSPKDRSQGTAIQFFVIRDHYLSKRLIASKHHVASLLPSKSETHFLQPPGATSTRDARKLAQTATSSVSNRSSGIGR